jgi:hypothetical protein
MVLCLWLYNEGEFTENYLQRYGWLYINMLVTLATTSGDSLAIFVYSEKRASRIYQSGESHECQRAQCFQRKNHRLDR